MALTELLADYTFGPRIDRRRVAAAGHSSGGLAVLLLAGVRLRPSDFLASCAGPRPGPDCALIAGLDVSAIPDLDRAGDRYHDRRIRAVAAMAPVMGLAATAASLRAVDVPVAIVGLPNDELVPFDRNAARYARLIRHAQLTTVLGAGHFVFMPVCTLPGRLVAAAVCVDIATSPDRAAVHDTTAATLVRFFERTLGAR
jgi:predicted dienelactone hydrolase